MVRKGGFEAPGPCGRQPLKRSRSAARRIFVGFSGPSVPIGDTGPAKTRTDPESLHGKEHTNDVSDPASTLATGNSPWSRYHGIVQSPLGMRMTRKRVLEIIADHRAELTSEFGVGPWLCSGP